MGFFLSILHQDTDTNIRFCTYICASIPVYMQHANTYMHTSYIITYTKNITLYYRSNSISSIRDTCKDLTVGTRPHGVDLIKKPSNKRVK